MAAAQFQLPDWFHLSAVFFGGIAGAIAAVRRRYDVIGVGVLALVSGLGGGLIRDVILQRGTPLIFTDGRYIIAVAFACVGAYGFSHWVKRLASVFSLLDALGLAAYSVIGAQLSLTAGLSLPAAVVVGTINAVGGGLIRDILTREEPLMFRPGHFYALAAAAGSAAFVLLHRKVHLDGGTAGTTSVILAFALRALAVRYDWRTRALSPTGEADAETKSPSTTENI
jgi:uncharacterized membrane protein YeiH